MTTITLPIGGDLWGTVHGAVAGDTVLLPSGNYGAVEMDRFVFAAPGVSIKAAPGAHPVFTGLHLDGSSGLSFQGIEVAMIPTQQYGVYVINSSGLAFDGLAVHQADNTTLSGVGVFLRDSSNISVSNSEFHHLGVGAQPMDTVFPVFTGNRFHDIETDGIDFAGCPGAQAISNSFTDFYPAVGDHPDAIQFWSTTAHPQPSGAVVKGNVIQRGKGQPMQGIFAEYQAAMTISGNAMTGTMYNGISVSGVLGASITGNFVQGWTDMGSRIIARGGSDTIWVGGNSISEAVVNLVQAGEAPVTNFTLGVNTTIPAAAVGDASAMLAWVAAQGAPPPVVDPRDAQIAALTTQVATLTQASIVATAKLTTANQTIVTLQSKIASLKTSLTTLAAQATTAAK